LKQGGGGLRRSLLIHVIHTEQFIAERLVAASIRGTLVCLTVTIAGSGIARHRTAAYRTLVLLAVLAVHGLLGAIFSVAFGYCVRHIRRFTHGHIFLRAK
jgi:hypothetical protein